MFKWLIRIKHFCVLKFSSLKSISIYHQNSEDMGHSLSDHGKQNCLKIRNQKLRESNLYKSNKTKQKDKDRLHAWVVFILYTCK